MYLLIQQKMENEDLGINRTCVISEEKKKERREGEKGGKKKVSPYQQSIKIPMSFKKFFKDVV